MRCLQFALAGSKTCSLVVFITTDIINEYFGKKGVRRISFIAVGCIAYAFLMIILVTKLSPAQFWLDVNGTDAEGQPFNVNFAFNKIYTQGLGIIIGSLVAFLIGQLLDVLVFQHLSMVLSFRNIL